MFKVVDDSVISGDIFNTDAELKVVTINTATAAMGRGIALSAKERWPDVYKIYRKRFKDGLLIPEDVWDITMDGDDPVAIAMFPTKIEWWKPSIPGLIIKNVSLLRRLAEEKNYKTIAVPPLGMINGWLRDDEVLKSIVMALRNEFHKSDLEVTLYCPQDLYLKIKRMFRVT